MNNNEILNKIIEENGNCCWSSKSICDNCPISKLKIKSDGSYFSCVEAVGIEGLSEEDADAKYKEVAEKLLLSEAIDQILGSLDAKS